MDVVIDQQHREVTGGDYRVSVLKETLGVPQHKALAEVEPFGLNHLDDEQSVSVRDGSRFISHARAGSAI